MLVGWFIIICVDVEVCSIEIFIVDEMIKVRLYFFLEIDIKVGELFLKVLRFISI